MKHKLLLSLLINAIVFPFVIQACFTSCALSHSGVDSVTYINRIEIYYPGVIRDNDSFQLDNITEGKARWEWKILDPDNGKVIRTSTDHSPTFKLHRGAYDVLVTAHGKNKLTRHLRRYITVLPKTFTEKEADEVINLNNIKDESFVKDYGKKVRPGYKILIKGKYNGRIKITGLKGTKSKPVHIINKGQVEITATNNNIPFAFQFSDDNQYIILDGKADPKVPYGFRIKGHPKKSGQILFIAGLFNKGFELCGLNLIGNQGKTHGAAAIQLQTAYSKACNANNWNFEYFNVHHNKIEEASSEGMYIGYFTDEVRNTGYAPFRLGQVVVYRDSVINSGWDAIQIACADEFEVHDNYVDGVALSGKRSHSSFLSWNSGNRQGWCYRNVFKNGAHAASIMFGETGKEAYLYSNLFIEGTYPEEINTPAFFFSKMNNTHQDVALYIFNNTIITNRIGAKVDYKNEKGNDGMKVFFAGNAISVDRLNLKKYPEIAMGSTLTDSTQWMIKNAWRKKEQEDELKWDSEYRPIEGSPLLESEVDVINNIPQLKGGYFDLEGYPLRHEQKGYTYGCYSAYHAERRVTPNN